MSKLTGPTLNNIPIPWQEKPDGCSAPMWRYHANPIIQRDAIPTSNSVFNSAVAPFQSGFAGIFRCDSKAVSMDIYAGFSKDGIHWDINHEPIRFEGEPEVTKREYRYDPRICFLEDRYYITWCNGYHGPTIGVGYTFDFKKFYQLENAFLPYNRNGVLFPRKINGYYAMLSRPSDTGHTPFGDIFCSFSPDLTFWGKHRYVMGAVNEDKTAWQSKKIGPGPTPLETSEGWLLIYHGVINTCDGFVYRMGCALLDLAEPWKVKMRSRFYILGPQELYERVGDVPNVTFPCATLSDAATGHIAVYYGCADTVTGLAFTTVDELMDYMEKYPLEEAQK
ncbi:MAG TPA: glycoside hydrolase family 130 protein [Caproicibacter sp.]|nr:glycoside hydrolase family 130 protein [Caproicibacter sp.]